MVHVVRRGDLTMFEYLVERGVVIPSDLDEELTGFVASMLHHRRTWIKQARWLAHEQHIPLIAIRAIHEYVVGFNWSAVFETLSNLAGPNSPRKQANSTRQRSYHSL